MADTPEGIPLEKAVQDQLIPCSVCGAKGADVRQVEGKKHFLCGACHARGRRWTLGVIAAAVALVAIVVGVRLNSGGPAAPPRGAGTPAPLSREELRAIETKIAELVRARKFAEAQKELLPLLDQDPDAPMLNLYMGRCCYGLSQYELSLAAWPRAARDPKNAEECRFRTAEALEQLGYSSRAKVFLEKPFSGPFEESRNTILVQVLVDLEEYDQALKLLETMPVNSNVLFYRHRALVYQGKPDLARKVYAAAPTNAADRIYRAQALAGQAREEGDFEAARKILDEALASVDPASFDVLRLRRFRLAVHLESGDLASLEKEATELLQSGEPLTLGESLWYRAMGRLAGGKRDLARADAKDMLEKCDTRLGWLRMETLMMEHLLGRRKDEDLEREARAVNRFRANDLYYYLALSTGKSEWAEKALAATPGHNAPYHAIKRFLKGR